MFYLSYRPVITESAKTTNLRIVYHASSKSTSLNDPLQNSMGDILVKSRFKPPLLCGDIKKLSHR